MHLVVLLRFIFYGVSVVLHSALAIATFVLTNKMSISGSNRNHTPIIIGVIWAVVLSLLIGCDLTRSRRPGSLNRERRWIVRTWSELGVFLHLMFWDLLFCALNTHADLTSNNCENNVSDHPNRCKFNPFISGLWWSATATVTIYFWGLFVFGCLVVRDLDSETNVRDHYEDPERKVSKYDPYILYQKQLGFGELDGAPERFSTFASEWDWAHTASSALTKPQAARLP